MGSRQHATITGQPAAGEHPAAALTSLEADLHRFAAPEANIETSPPPAGDAWIHEQVQIYPNAKVCGHAHVHDRAVICGHAEVHDDAEVCHDAMVGGNAYVSGDACINSNAVVGGAASVDGNVNVGGNARIYGHAQVGGHAHIGGHAQVGGRACVGGRARITGNVRICGNVYIAGSAHVSGDGDYYYLRAGHLAGQVDITAPHHAQTWRADDGTLWTVARSRAEAGFEVWEGARKRSDDFPGPVLEIVSAVLHAD